MFADFSLQASILGLSAADMARKYQVQERTARRWIAGKAKPPIPVMDDVEDSFNSFLESLGSIVETLYVGGEVYKRVLDIDDPNYKHHRPLVQAIYLLCRLRGIGTEVTFS